jgi:hypothetical protein
VNEYDKVMTKLFPAVWKRFMSCRQDPHSAPMSRFTVLTLRGLHHCEDYAIWNTGILQFL